MVFVHAWRGPLVGRRVEIPDEDVEDATAPDGWAQKLEPGTELVRDTAAPTDPKWKMPGSTPGIAAPAKPVEPVEEDRDMTAGEGGEYETRDMPRRRPGRPAKHR
jgi:hypothetical protein